MPDYNAPTSAATSPAPAGGGSGAGALASPVSPLHALANLLAEEPQPSVTASHEAPPASGTDAPGNPPAAGAEAAPGEPTSPPAETTPAEGETPEGESDANPPSESETQKAEASKATQKRIDALTAEKYRLREENEALQARLKEAEAQATSDARPHTPDALPPGVTKLRSVAEVEARQTQLETLVDGLQDFLDANPGAPDTVYDAQTQQAVNVEADGKRYLTRAQIVAERAQWRSELKALPKRAAQITHTEQLRGTHAQLQARLAEKFPHLADPEHAETKMFQAALAMPLIANHPGGPLIALKLAKGHTLVEAELARANGNGSGNGHGKPVFGNAGQRPAPLGKVPVRQTGPSGGGSPPSPAAGRANVAAALDRNRKEGSRESLAALIAAGGL